MKAPGSPEGAKPGQPNGATKPGDDKGGSDTIKRPDKPLTPPNPDEFKARPDEEGIVRFQFRGQSWPDVLEWFGEISGRSVDWQELPKDYLNISTQRGYTVEELRDLLNRLLLTRGFTMLQQDEFINVVKCEEINASLVPSVPRSELARLAPHDFVRVMFDLDWMLADDAADELEPLLSKNGKLFPFATTNRMEAMDAVVNLRDLDRLLTEEQASEAGEGRLVQEFVLHYVRAEDVRQSLSQFLGAGSPGVGSAGAMSPQVLAQQQAMMKMQQQMQQQMQKQMQQQAQAAARTQSRTSSRNRRANRSGANGEQPVRMMVNPRRNSLIVQAPPDKMATIAQAIKLMDVREEGPQSLQAFLGRMQVYRLAQLDPRKLVDTLQELGGLDPTTRLEVDDTNHAIIAYATPADHFTVRSTIEKLDGSARRVEVIPLRRLAADEVAGTIQYLMSGTKQQSSRSNYMDYGYGYRYSSRRDRNEPSQDEFRVDADIENNRLLVRATTWSWRRSSVF